MAYIIGVILATVTAIFTISLVVGFIAKLFNKSQISYSINSSLFIGIGLSVGSIVLAFNADKIPGDRSASEFVLQSLAILISTWIVILIYKKVILSRDREKQERETQRRAKETETEQNTQKSDTRPEPKETDISKRLLFGAVAILIFLFILGSLSSESTSNIAAPVETNGAAFTAYEQKDVPELRDLATKGDAVAQFYLGYMYDNGEGVAQDYAAAVDWYRKAAEQGNASAQNNLGVKYDNGEGVAQDDAAAVSWYRKSAEQGNAKAQFNLGYMYDDGEGVAQDYVQAHKWYNLATASVADTEARSHATAVRDALAAKMQPAQIAEAQRLASAWRKK